MIQAPLIREMCACSKIHRPKKKLQAFIASYLATWTPHTFGKPVDRTPGRIKQWIQTVYIDARFKGTPKAPAAPSPGPVANGVRTPVVGGT